MENKKNINGMDYMLEGDCYIPDLKLPEEDRPIEKYGRMHRDYLKEHHPIRFYDLILNRQLWMYLAALNEQSQERLSLIIDLTEYDTPPGKEYKELLQLICRNEEKLQATFTEEQKDLFSRYVDCVREFQARVNCLLFRNSFKLGARMMLEVMDE